jgi:cell division protein FtsN
MIVVEGYPNRMIIFMVFATAGIITLIAFASFGIAQGQVNASTLTPQQRDAICNPNNPASKLNPVNTTESRICGIPVTVNPHPSNATTSPSNMTTGAQALSPPT